jgi:hypothetical protein
MSRLWKWIEERYKQFDLLPTYFPLLFTRWQVLLWGGSVLAVAWGLSFIVGSPPLWVNWTAVFIALFFAGYYVWRSDHIRLIPRFEIAEVFVVEAVPTLRSDYPSGNSRAIVQLALKCLGDVPVEECEGLLLAIYKWEGLWWNGYWERTGISETLHLEWSHGEGCQTMTLQSGGERRLNICTAEGPYIVPCTTPLAIRASTDLAIKPGDTTIFRFDVMVISRDYNSLRTSVGVQNGGAKEGTYTLCPIAKILNLSNSTPW